MARQAKIVLVAPHAPERDKLLDGLTAESHNVAILDGAAEVSNQPGTPDLVVIDAAVGSPLPVVQACRQRWPDRMTQVLVLNAPDLQTSAAAIDAGASDSVLDAIEQPMLNAHVRRMLRTTDQLRAMLDEASDTIRRESLARAAAAVAKPLGDLVDEMESIMDHPSPKAFMSDLLDRVSQAVDAVERLRQLASPSRPAMDGAHRVDDLRL